VSEVFDPPAPRYRLLDRGVLELATGAVVLPGTPEWDVYRAWPGPTAPMATAPAPDRIAALLAGNAQSMREREIERMSNSDYLTFIRKGTT
jgi:hypothetical protein